MFHTMTDRRTRVKAATRGLAFLHALSVLVLSHLHPKRAVPFRVSVSIAL